MSKYQDSEEVKQARKEAYSLGFETAKKIYTHKMIPKTKAYKIYSEIAIAFTQTTGIKESLFIDYLNDKASMQDLEQL